MEVNSKIIRDLYQGVYWYAFWVMSSLAESKREPDLQVIESGIKWFHDRYDLIELIQFQLLESDPVEWRFCQYSLSARTHVGLWRDVLNHFLSISDGGAYTLLGDFDLSRSLDQTAKGLETEYMNTLKKLELSFLPSRLAKIHQVASNSKWKDCLEGNIAWIYWDISGDQKTELADASSNDAQKEEPSKPEADAHSEELLRLKTEAELSSLTPKQRLYVFCGKIWSNYKAKEEKNPNRSAKDGPIAIKECWEIAKSEGWKQDLEEFIRHAKEGVKKNRKWTPFVEGTKGKKIPLEKYLT